MRATSSSDRRSRPKKPFLSTGYPIRYPPLRPASMRTALLLLTIPFALCAQAPQPHPQPTLTGEQLFEARRFDEAKAAFQQQLARDKNNANAQFYMGRVEYVQGRSGDAVDWFEKAVQRDEKNAT